MVYRMVDCATWDDGWFSELPPDGKLLFLNLLTNSRSTPAGAFEVTIRTMAFETGLSTDRVTELLSSFGDRVVYWPEHGIVWLRNFFRRQHGNEKFTISARRIIAALPPEVRERVCHEYPHLSPSVDTHPIPIGVGMDSHPLETETVTEIETEIATATEIETGESLREGETAEGEIAADAAVGVPKPTKDPPGFREFWSSYPKKEGRAKAVDQWKKLRPPPEQRQVMLDAIATQKFSDKWRRGYVMEAARWLRERRWEDEIEPEPGLNGVAPPRMNASDYAGESYLETAGRHRSTE